MSENLARLYRARNPEPDGDGYVEDLHPDERKAYAKMLAEAKRNGATLANEGKGGLPPSKVLGIFRRDKWACKRCDGKKELSVHHRGGIYASKQLEKLGHKNTESNLVTICEPCHSNLHDEAREEGIDSSQHKESEQG